MKMKMTSVTFFAMSAFVSLLAPGLGILFAIFFGAAFGAYGVAASVAKHLDPLNDVPNAFRVFLASLGGVLITVTWSFVFPSAGVLLFVSALFLNDEFQRRAIYALRTGRKGGSIALLGIDGSGKSTHSTVTGKWLETRGYSSNVMPFHRYIFVERLASVRAAGRRGTGRGERFKFKRGGNPVRPVLSLVDNLVMQLYSSAGCRLEGKVVIYDRFIWSTYIKYKALGYPVKAISRLYLSPRPTFALVLNVPVEKSLQVIDERVTHIHYPRDVLESERQEYLDIATRRGYPVIDAAAPFDEVQQKIEARLEMFFPPVGRGAEAR